MKTVNTVTEDIFFDIASAEDGLSRLLSAGFFFEIILIEGGMFSLLGPGLSIIYFPIQKFITQIIAYVCIKKTDISYFFYVLKRTGGKLKKSHN